MLNYYPANRTEDLIEVLAGLLRQDPNPDPFVQEWVLTPSQGMGTWIQQSLSARMEIVANLECIKPAQFFWQLAGRLDAQLVADPRFDKNVLRWHIFERLPRWLSEPAFKPLQGYCQRAGEGEGVLLELSQAISDVMDAYQIYRPDWLAAWEAGEMPPELCREPFARHALWQREVWRQIYPEIPLAQRQHRANCLRAFSGALANAKLSDALPKRIFVFGLGALPLQFFELAERLSQHCTLHLLLHNPCRYYWGDLRSPQHALREAKKMSMASIESVDVVLAAQAESNPLLASWGAQGRDYLACLVQLPGVQEMDYSLFESPLVQHETSLLKHLQNDILELQVRPYVIDPHDYSLIFADCHSALREVEALHDHVLDCLDQNPDLAAHDIIVMMPDVSHYAALIDAVFSRPFLGADGAQQCLDYAISDQPMSLDQPQIEALLAWLTLPQLRLDHTQILEWLALPALRSALGLDDESVVKVQQWVEALNIRWGLDQSHRDRCLQMQGSGAANTWRAGFERLLQGHLYGTESLLSDVTGDVLPFAPQAQEEAELAACLLRFLDLIEETLHCFSQQLTSAQWFEQLVNLWPRWFDPEVLDEAVVQSLNQALEQFLNETLVAGFANALPFSLVAQSLSDALRNERVSQRFLSGRINFCNLMPLRTIPFSIVCLLGMNDGAYPHPEKQQSFDLLASAPKRPGDRSRRQEDRYLFLEALCSARQQLYISYVGRAAQDNSQREPSLLVSELQDYCRQQGALAGGGDPVAHLTRRHRLQAFHPDYYPVRATASPRLPHCLPPSFSLDWSEDRLVIEVHDQGTRPELPAEIHLDWLSALVGDPLRAYYRQTLQLQLDAFEESATVEEPFALDGLDRFRLAQAQLLAWRDTAEDELDDESNAAPSLLTEWRLQGRLPRAPLDRMVWQEECQRLQPLRQHLRHAFSQHGISSQAFVLAWQGARVFGQFAISPIGQVELSASPKQEKDFFAFWVRHVVWNYYLGSSGESTEASGASVKLTPASQLSLPPLTSADAAAYFAQIMTLAQDALRAPQLFLPKTAYAQIFSKDSEAQNQFRNESQRADWLRACLCGDWQGTQAPEQMPELTTHVLLQQVMKYREQVSIVEWPDCPRASV